MIFSNKRPNENIILLGLNELLPIQTINEISLKLKVVKLSQLLSQLKLRVIHYRLNFRSRRFRRNAVDCFQYDSYLTLQDEASSCKTFTFYPSFHGRILFISSRITTSQIGSLLSNRFPPSSLSKPCENTAVNSIIGCK